MSGHFSKITGLWHVRAGSPGSPTYTRALVLPPSTERRGALVISFDDVSKLYPTAEPARPRGRLPGGREGRVRLPRRPVRAPASRPSCGWCSARSSRQPGQVYVLGKDLAPAVELEDPGAAPPGRHRVPGLPAAAEQDGRRERRVRASRSSASRATRSAQVVPEVLELVGLHGKENRLPGRALRWRAAARRDRARVRQPPDAADRRRADRQPRPAAPVVGIMKLLDRINRTGTTVVMATHDDKIVDQMRRRVIELEGRSPRPRPVARRLRMGRLMRSQFVVQEIGHRPPAQPDHDHRGRSSPSPSSLDPARRGPAAPLAGRRR